MPDFNNVPLQGNSLMSFMGWPKARTILGLCPILAIAQNNGYLITREGDGLPEYASEVCKRVPDPTVFHLRTVTHTPDSLYGTVTETIEVIIPNTVTQTVTQVDQPNTVTVTSTVTAEPTSTVSSNDKSMCHAKYSALSVGY